MGLLPDNLDFTRNRCTAQESTLEGTRSLVLDNGVLRLSLLPEYGARLCSLYYRPLGLELLATEFVRDQRHGLHVRGGWGAAFPSLLADGEVISRLAWEAEIVEQRDEQVTLRAWCLVERISHVIDGNVRSTPITIHVDRFIRLKAGEPAVEVEDVLTNRNTWPAPTTWSGVISLRARVGDRVVLPVDAVEVQRGVGPTGNELDFSLLVNTPYQALARNLREGWLGLRMGSAPVDVKITFPRDLLPHAVIGAQRDEARPAEDAFRFQPLATPAPIADDTRGGALVLPTKRPVSLPIRLELGAGILTSGDWSRPGMQLAELILGQQVPPGRLALWRVGGRTIVLKSHRYLALLMPELDGEDLLQPEDLPAADLILCSASPPDAMLGRLAQRTSARFVGPPSLRQRLLKAGVSEERSFALSPGARVDLPGFGALATPARADVPGEQLGYLLGVDHLSLYHAGPTQFLGEFAPIGEQFHPQLVLLPLSEMTQPDAVNAAKQLQPRLVVPLGTEAAEREFADRCRAQHVAFATRLLHPAEGAFFDGWKLLPLG
jgi:L-ascorbate metabolism protein UlaG (beta-lactamase superfamily)